MKYTTFALIFIASVEWIGISPVSVTVLFGLMVTDTITGLLKSVVLGGWHKLTSFNFTSGILKKVLLLLGVFAVGVAGRGAGFDMGAYVQGLVSMLILAEVYSIFGNIYAAHTGKEDVNEFDAFTAIIGGALAFIRKMLEMKK